MTESPQVQIDVIFFLLLHKKKLFPPNNQSNTSSALRKTSSTDTGCDFLDLTPQLSQDYHQRRGGNGM